MLVHLSYNLADPLFQNSHVHDENNLLVYHRERNSYFFRANDFEDCGINDNQVRQCPSNLVDETSFLFQTALVIGMSSFLSVVDLYPN